PEPWCFLLQSELLPGVQDHAADKPDAPIGRCMPMYSIAFDGKLPVAVARDLDRRSGVANKLKLQHIVLGGPDRQHFADSFAQDAEWQLAVHLCAEGCPRTFRRYVQRGRARRESNGPPELR